MNDIVKYENEFNEAVFGNRTEINRKTGKKQDITWRQQDLKTFFAIISKVRERGSERVEISLDYLKEISGYDSHGYTKFIDHLGNLYDKKLALIHFAKFNEKGDFIGFPVFTYFETGTKAGTNEKILTVQVHERAVRFLNNLNSNFTRFELSEIVSLKNKYSILLYRELKQFRLTGMWNVSYEHFKYLMGVDNYDNREVRKTVLNPAVKELELYFKDLKVDRQYSETERGKPISRLVFTFTPEKPRVFADTKAEDRFADYAVEHGIISSEQWGNYGEVYVPEPLPPKEKITEDAFFWEMTEAEQDNMVF